MRFPGFRDRTTHPTVPGGSVVTPAAGTGAVIHDTTYVQDRGAERAARHDVVDDRHDAANAHRLAAEADKRAKAEYQRGLRDGVRAKRNSPVLTILVLLLALLGIAVGVLAIVNGSFREAGAVLDRSAGIAAVEARDAGGELAQDAGSTLQAVGADAERDAEAARR